MRSVSWMRRIGAAALVMALLVPSALACDATPTDPSLWAEFVAWLQEQILIPRGVAADGDGFTVWLMSRILIPGG